jgi:hypothetical protein
VSKRGMRARGEEWKGRKHAYDAAPKGKAEGRKQNDRRTQQPGSWVATGNTLSTPSHATPLCPAPPFTPKAARDFFQIRDLTAVQTPRTSLPCTTSSNLFFYLSSRCSAHPLLCHIYPRTTPHCIFILRGLPIIWLTT